MPVNRCFCASVIINASQVYLILTDKTLSESSKWTSNVSNNKVATSLSGAPSLPGPYSGILSAHSSEYPNVPALEKATSLAAGLF